MQGEKVGFRGQSHRWQRSASWAGPRALLRPPFRHCTGEGCASLLIPRASPRCRGTRGQQLPHTHRVRPPRRGAGQGGRGGQRGLGSKQDRGTRRKCHDTSVELTEPICRNWGTLGAVGALAGTQAARGKAAGARGKVQEEAQEAPCHAAEATGQDLGREAGPGARPTSTPIRWPFPSQSCGVSSRTMTITPMFRNNCLALPHFGETERTTGCLREQGREAVPGGKEREGPEGEDERTRGAAPALPSCRGSCSVPACRRGLLHVQGRAAGPLDQPAPGGSRRGRPGPSAHVSAAGENPHAGTESVSF